MFFQEIDIQQQQNEYFPLLQQLYPFLIKEDFEVLIEHMLDGGYKLIGLYDHSKLVAIAGISIAFNLYDGKHLYLYDLVCDENYRSRGYGKRMVEYLEHTANEAECSSIVLCSKFERVDAIRFYTEKLGFKKTKYVIERKL
ncbi:GNAT family N-acetyltransferase [Rummeliibacillus suwonensis]|uniref:GNAT family N-acetyltransferase n=1 Tax=Rummeliibacillus suwonensis TaxID=1306154 RepID=UPI001644D30A|nr:GNAT family N-acetyltransferase [Rummeliibacillus suwonensis]